MPDSNDHEIPPEQEQLSQLLTKILEYQYSLSDGRAVELEELQREGVLTPADIEFLTSHSVTYKPHRLSDYHASDMFHMPTPGGCLFLGPAGPELVERRAPLRVFQSIVEGFLRLPQDELLLHIQFTEDDGMGVSPSMISFTLRTAEWRERLPAIRSAAAEFNLDPFQDEDVQGSWTLTFRISLEAARTAAVAVALLSRGCGFTDETEVIYSAGALDQG